ncbi:Nucleotidylyl transferase [Daedaleopsis nitida]|nr:Nucleotidylyl transferase [Daedaleopsis nitida]
MSCSALLQRVQRGLSTVELIHTSHPRWPLPPTPHLAPTLQISVLDSSFNPPTLAHLALANLRPSPSTAPLASPANSGGTDATEGDFDARLLLLSVRNADKQLKPGDATFEQRMEMMVLLAQDLSDPSSPYVETTREPNIAVAIIDEPTFVRKSDFLLDFLRKRILQLSSAGVALPTPSTRPPIPKLTFLMGTDTIVRLFAPRYYADERAMTDALHHFLSPAENDSRVICARRSSKSMSGQAEQEVEVHLPELLHDVAPTDRVTFVDIGERECAYSSSEVRERLASHDQQWKDMVTSRVAEYIIQSNLYYPMNS